VCYAAAPHTPLKQGGMREWNMKEGILKIKDRPLSDVIDTFYICEKCNIVDEDSNRGEHGYLCTNCHKPDNRGMSYYSTQVGSLINLMQEFYHTHQIKTDDIAEARIPFWGINIKLPIIIFYTTLKELLLNNLIDEIFKARKLEIDICQRLLSDNPGYMMRRGLFGSLAGEKWKSALKIIDHDEGTNYKALNEFLQKVDLARNDFVHNGKTWEIENTNMAEECIEETYSLLRLHVLLHNYFVYPIYADNKDESS
jgi:hypothetical protein